MVNLLTDRLTIRDLDLTDLDFIHKLHSLPEVQKFATLDIPKSINESQSYLTRYIEQQSAPFRTEYAFCITLENQEPIGLIGLSNRSAKFKSAELWFKLSREYWGNGYIMEAAIRLLEFGFKDLILHRIEAGVDTENIASIKVLEKVGMQREGVRRKVLPIKGDWKDNFHYAILEEDYFREPCSQPLTTNDRKAHSVNEASGMLKDKGLLFTEVFTHGTLSVEFYKPDKVDLQQPHDRDEIYVIASGTGSFHNAGQERKFGPGDFLFVAAGEKHWFENFTDDFATWVFFYGPLTTRNRMVLKRFI